VAGAGAATGPAVFALEQNVPNPFNPATSIHFGLARNGYATLAIYDVTGRMVRRLVDGAMAAGRHEVRWTGATVTAAASPRGSISAGWRQATARPCGRWRS